MITLSEACITRGCAARPLEVNGAKKVALPDPKNERDRILSEEEWGRLYEVAAPHLKPILLVT